MPLNLKDASSAVPQWRCIISLPPRNDCTAHTEQSWELELPGGVDFEGQHFDIPGVCSASAYAQWLEPELLSVKISVKAEASVPCARCLKQTPLAISDVLMYLYYSGSGEAGSDAAGLESDNADDSFLPVEVEFFGRTLDAAPQVWESLLLLLPSKVLCRDDCAGLCPNCGADLNDGPCDCKNADTDPRFEALRGFEV